jgi:hypothetical protein
MKIYIVKIATEDVVEQVVAGQEFIHDGIYTFEGLLRVGDPVIIYLGGDKAQISWEQGIRGVGKVTAAPFDKGYDPNKPKNFKIKVQPLNVLAKSIPPKVARTHSRLAHDIYEIPYIGANHFPTQAISSYEEPAGIKALATLYNEYGNYDFGELVELPANCLEEYYSASGERGVVNDSGRDFLVDQFVEWFFLSENYVKSYDGLVCREILVFWDNTYFNGTLFKIDPDNHIQSIQNLERQLTAPNQDPRWEKYSYATNRGAPRAVLGSRNYLKFLGEFFTNPEKREKYKQRVNVFVATGSLTGAVCTLPKPFVLLAGISGTGKTRFVCEQAKSSAQVFGLPAGDNFCMVPVRPDWHEPSDLLGYVSRINGASYIPTQFLKFLVEAWREVFRKNGTLRSLGANTCPYWLCLDEMNLAPVEQYFADYLSVLETRKWDDGVYFSEPLLSDHLDLVRAALGGTEDDPVWKAFAENGGIPLPQNLIVAGTVNMDETTHGFSRKVIDRALTIDFQEFFPNDFDVFFEGQHPPVTLSFPVQSGVMKEQLGSFKRVDVEITSLVFLQKVNKILKGTPFELAYRALNELYLSEVCFKPDTPEAFQAVWDDYLMQKVLPRIEGDAAKLKNIADPAVSCASLVDKDHGKGTILHALYSLLETDLFREIWPTAEEKEKRPDLLRDTEALIECRAKKKLEWMMRRLKTNHFTDFWV